MTQLKAVLFDLDGTLIDSEHFHYECWMEILNNYSINLPYAEWVKTYAGYTLPTNCKRIKATYQLDIPLEELISWRESLSIKGFSTRDINLMPYALETLEFFKNKGLKIALVTASPRNNVELIFERNGLGHFFDTMVTRTDVAESKPDPECYLMACRNLGVQTSEALAFEDTINGLTAAKGANITCYAVQFDTVQHPGLSIADKIFFNLNEATSHLTAEKLI